jgi:hypothetical protein
LPVARVLDQVALLPLGPDDEDDVVHLVGLAVDIALGRSRVRGRNAVALRIWCSCGEQKLRLSFVSIHVPSAVGRRGTRMPTPYIGQIIMFAGDFAPQGWALCQGQLLPIADNAALFQLIGTTYGGDGDATFALPDLRGRVPIGDGQGRGLSIMRSASRSASRRSR